MASLERPKLRPLSAQRLEHQGRSYAALEDPLGVFDDPVLIPLDGFHCDRPPPGRQDDAAGDPGAGTAATWGSGSRLSTLREMVEQLDQAMVLDGPTFAAFHAAYRQERVRPPALAGRSYAGHRVAPSGRNWRSSLRTTGGRGFRRTEDHAERAARLRGVLSPHIDFHRGGPVYTWSYKELVEQSDADTFVILGVAHQYCRNRFALDPQGLRDPAGPGPDRRRLCRSNRRGARAPTCSRTS